MTTVYCLQFYRRLFGTRESIRLEEVREGKKTKTKRKKEEEEQFIAG
jgi:hypothetical protein